MSGSKLIGVLRTVTKSDGNLTYGEFGRAINGKHEFHSTTCSWVALKENK
ncbi:MAG: hypothetical protein ABR502_06865 [Chitinophagaceae bacterium]